MWIFVELLHLKLKKLVTIICEKNASFTISVIRMYEYKTNMAGFLIQPLQFDI